MRKILLMTVLWGIALAAMPQELLPVWAKSFGGPEWDMANAMCVSPTGDVIIAGTFPDSITIEGQRFYSKGYTDVFIATYSKDGTPIGAFTLGGKGNDRALFANYGNNLVLLAQFQSPFDAGSQKIDSTGLVNYMLGWFDEKGSLVSSSTISSTGQLSITSMDGDTDGSLYLTGSYTDTLRINGKDNSVAQTESTLLLMLTSKGKSHSLKLVEGLDGKQVNACTFQNGNKMMVAGITNVNDDKDAFRPEIAYQTLFTATMNQGGKISGMQTLVKGVAIEPVSVVESKQSTWIAAKFRNYCLNGADTLKARGQSDILLAKIPSKKDDIQVWTIGGYGEDTPLYLKTSGNQAILAGSFSDTLWFSEKDFMVADEMGSDLFMAVFDDNTTPVKSLSVGGPYNDFPCAMVTADAGVYVLGQFKDTLRVANEEFIPEGSYDVFVTRFENCGAKQPIEIFAEKLKGENGAQGYRLCIGDGYTNYQWSDGLGFTTSVVADKATSYSVEATDLFGCKCRGEIDLSKLKSALVTADTQLSNAQQAKFKLYPTVTEGVVYWQPGSKFPSTGATLRVFDAKGSTVITREYATALSPLSVEILNMGKLIPGQYLIKVTGEGYKESVKVIVK